MRYQVSYDLEEPNGGDYDKLFEVIKEISNGRSKILLSTWVIFSELSSSQIREKLKTSINNKIEIFISKIDSDRSWYLAKQRSDFLNQNLKKT